MNKPVQSMQGDTAEQKNVPGRLQGISVIASVLLPILAAYIVFYTGLGMPEGTLNEGDLIKPPRELESLPLTASDGSRYKLSAIDHKWRYLIVSGSDCTETCEKMLYTSRQVHIRLGEKADRLERMLVTTSPLGRECRAQLQQEHPRLRFASVDAAALNRLLYGTNHKELPQPGTLVVDQQGFAMMVYDHHHSGNQMLKDIKRLLKYSYEK